MAYDGRWLWYMDPAWAEPQNLAYRFTELSVLHELGHVYDSGGLPDRHQYPLPQGARHGWLARPAKRDLGFAMGYAYCAGRSMSWAEFRFTTTCRRRVRFKLNRAGRVLGLRV